jgi:hypothetical protein
VSLTQPGRTYAPILSFSLVTGAAALLTPWQMSHCAQTHPQFALMPVATVPAGVVFRQCGFAAGTLQASRDVRILSPLLLSRSCSIVQTAQASF